METTKKGAPPQLTPMLELAEKWAMGMGCQTARITATLPDGTVEPALSIKRGQFVIFCKEQSGALLLLAILEIPSESRSRLRMLDKPTKDKLLTALKLAIMQNERTGFSLFPEDIQSVDELQKFSLSQIVRLSESDTSSFNRFADAIQELTTGIVRSMMAFGPLMFTQPGRVVDSMYR